MSMSPSVAVLLCTYQGERFLVEQLNSIHSQDHPNLSLWVSDDGSKDRTISLLEEAQAQWGRDKFSIVKGPQKGFVANFLSLTSNPEIQADYFAWSDQDDIWEKDRISRAIAWLNTLPATVPALYGTRTRLTDENDYEIGCSSLFTKPLSFKNALVQSIVGGNTLVMNHAARELIYQASKDNQKVASHEWWAYMLISGAGGAVYYDPYLSIRYRQHGNNVMGANVSLHARLYRLWQLFNGQFKKWNSLNIEALSRVRNLLTPENQATLECFSKARSGNLISRLCNYQKSGVYRQRFLDNIALFFSVIINKL